LRIARIIFCSVEQHHVLLAQHLGNYDGAPPAGQLVRGDCQALLGDAALLIVARGGGEPLIGELSIRCRLRPSPERVHDAGGYAPQQGL